MDPPDPHFDLIIRAGRVVCPSSGIDSPGYVTVRAGHIVAVKQADITNTAPVTADRVYDYPDGILLPGLIDMHAHPANSGSVFGVPPDDRMLSYGTTTVLSQGDAGASNIQQYIEETIVPSRTRVLLAINLSRIGESASHGCFENLEDVDVDACVAAVDRHREWIPAVAVNVSDRACGQTDPREVLRRGIQVAEQAGLPILFGMRRPEDWPLAQQLALLRPGDIVTYCFRSQPHCIIESGKVLDCIREARHRGIVFDIGHGTSAFCFEVAQAAIEDGFPPDTISTDLQRFHLDQVTRHDLPRVMSELQAAGMSELEVFAAATSRPASLLQRVDVGVLRADATADLTVLQASSSRPIGNAAAGPRAGVLWTPALVVKQGAVVAPQARPGNCSPR